MAEAPDAGSGRGAASGRLALLLLIALLVLVLGFASDVLVASTRGDTLQGPGLDEVLLVFISLPFAWAFVMLFVDGRRIRFDLDGLRAELRSRTAAENALQLRRAFHRTRVTDLIEEGHVSAVVQPIFDLVSRRAVGYEALARFHDGRAPEAWLKEATSAGLGVELELECVRIALKALTHVPASRYLSVNVSCEALASEEFQRMVTLADTHRVVIELTEHAQVTSYEEINDIVGRLRKMGLRLAVDDAGAGFASFRHIVQLSPDYIKLDRDLIRNVHADTVRRTLAASLVMFARDIGAVLIAEGVETAEECQILQDLGLRYGQGFFLARPRPVSELRVA